jgi:hypothetical protein
MSDEILQATAATACSTEEEIACLVDGVLAPEETERLLEHLLACPRCHELYTALLHLELERQGEQAGDKEARVVRFPRAAFTSRPALRWATMAAGLVVAAGLAYLTGSAWLAKGRPSEVVKRRVASIAQSSRVFDYLLVDSLSVYRDANPEPENNELAALFQIGALWADAEVAIKRNRLDSLAKTLVELQASAKVSLSTTELDEDLEKLTVRVQNAKSTRDVEPDLRRALSTLDDLSGQFREIVLLGQWWEGGRIAAEVGDRNFFSQPENHKYLTRLLSDPKFDGRPLDLGAIAPELPAALQEIAKLWPSEGAQDMKFQELAKQFARVLDLNSPKD